MNKCNSCNIKFRANAKKIGCGFCGKWFHAEECAKMKKGLWDLISTEEQIHWYCNECNGIAPDVMQIIQKCVKDNMHLNNEVEQVIKVVKEIKEGKDEAFNETIRNIVKEVYQESGANSPETQRTNPEVVRNIAREEVIENNDKKGREQNIVITNINEDKDANQEVEDLLTHLDVTVEVQAIRRMGKERKPNKTRSVWVKLSSKKERNTVLENAKKLAGVNRWKEVYVNKDMTETEQKEAYELRKELRERRREEGAERGQSKYVIHKGRVVEKKEQPREGETPSDGNRDGEQEQQD